MFLNWRISSPGQERTAPNRACLHNLLPLPCEPMATAALPITSLQHALANAQPHFYFLFSHYLTFTAYPKWIIWSFCFFILYYLFSWVGPTTRKYPSWTRTHLKLSSKFKCFNIQTKVLFFQIVRLEIQHCAVYLFCNGEIWGLIPFLLGLGWPYWLTSNQKNERNWCNFWD